MERKATSIVSLSQSKGKMTIGYIAHSANDDHQMTIVFDDNYHELPEIPLENLNEAWRKLSFFGLHAVGIVSEEKADSCLHLWRDGLVTDGGIETYIDHINRQTDVRGLTFGDAGQSVKMKLAHCPDENSNARHGITTAWMPLQEMQPNKYHLTQFWEFMNELCDTIKLSLCQIIAQTTKKQHHQLSLFELEQAIKPIGQPSPQIKEYV